MSDEVGKEIDIQIERICKMIEDAEVPVSVKVLQGILGSLEKRRKENEELEKLRTENEERGKVNVELRKAIVELRKENEVIGKEKTDGAKKEADFGLSIEVLDRSGKKMADAVISDFAGNRYGQGAFRMVNDLSLGDLLDAPVIVTSYGRLTDKGVLRHTSDIAVSIKIDDASPSSDEWKPHFSLTLMTAGGRWWVVSFELPDVKKEKFLEFANIDAKECLEWSGFWEKKVCFCNVYDFFGAAAAVTLIGAKTWVGLLPPTKTTPF